MLLSSAAVKNDIDPDSGILEHALSGNSAASADFNLHTQPAQPASTNFALVTLAPQPLMCNRVMHDVVLVRFAPPFGSRSSDARFAF